MCVEKLEKLNIIVYLPLLCNKMSKRSNPNINDPVDYYRITIFLPFIDSIRSDLAICFSDKIIRIFNLDLFLPNILTQAFLDKTCMANKFLIKDHLSKYVSLSKDLVEIILKGEIKLWFEFCVHNDEIK